MIESIKTDRRIKSFRELNVYKMAFHSAMDIFQLTKSFPVEEKYSLTDQIRRSSRSVCSNLSEAWRKRRYKAAFRSKLSDCSSEAAETQAWLDFALNCRYIDKEKFNELDNKFEQIFAMLNGMDQKAQTFCSS